MEDIEVGQELEFFEPAHLDDRVIEKGTRVRVGYITEELLEPRVIVVVLGTEPPQTVMMPKHVLMLHTVLAPKRR